MENYRKNVIGEGRRDKDCLSPLEDQPGQEKEAYPTILEGKQRMRRMHRGYFMILE